MPERDSRALYEKLILDGFQAGLSWITILRKREAFRAAFDNFDPEKIARYDRAKIETLMQNAGIIRNRAKIESTVTSARAFLKIEEAEGFSNYLWGFFDGKSHAKHLSRRDRNPGANAALGEDRQGFEEPGLQFLRPDGRLCLLSGDRHGERPPRQLLAACRMPGLCAAADERRRAWVRLPSGKRLDLLNPTPFDWEDKDLALGLARTYRWGGHSAWPLPLSVAQHSLLVLALHRHRFQGASEPRGGAARIAA